MHAVFGRRSAFAGLSAAAALGLGLPMLIRSAAAQPAAPAAPPGPAQAPGFFRFKLGDFTVTMVHDGFSPRPNPLEGFIRNATPADVEQALREAMLPTQNLPNPFTVTFIDTGRGIIAFDAGTGGGQLGGRTGTLPANLRAAGIDPAAVTMVAVSHFHADHITGLTTADNAVVFPNAEIWVPAAEWAFWSDESNSGRAPEAQRGTFANTRRRLTPYQARMRQFQDGQEIAAGVRAMAAYGHTPGHSVFYVTSGAEQLFVMADTSSRPDLFLRNPHWQSVFDVDGAMATETRRRLFGRIADDRARFTAYHFNFPSNGYVSRWGEGFRFHAAEWMSLE
ncbi:MAG: MBL fold metallo-hydrolase [Acetobacteraceae bacterium]|nr:MBL fold metallo-hydrolase [Acetobacteraceae bacterium]